MLLLSLVESLNFVAQKRNFSQLCLICDIWYLGSYCLGAGQHKWTSKIRIKTSTYNFTLWSKAVIKSLQMLVPNFCIFKKLKLFIFKTYVYKMLSFGRNIHVWGKKKVPAGQTEEGSCHRVATSCKKSNQTLHSSCSTTFSGRLAPHICFLIFFSYREFSCNAMKGTTQQSIAFMAMIFDMWPYDRMQA